MTDLAAQIRAAVAEIGVLTRPSKDRAAYREGRGRTLSRQHKEALAELHKALGILQERVGALLEPTPEELPMPEVPVGAARAGSPAMPPAA